MHTGRDNVGPLDRVLYQRASREHSSLRERLSSAAVHSLATEVINRISERFKPQTTADTALPSKTLEDFCHALIREDDETCLSMINAMVPPNGPADRVYLPYLGSAARLLGTWWEEDKTTFSEVTIGAGRIYAMLCALRPAMIDTISPKDKHAIFAAVPGEQHFLGVTMAADMFRAREWEIDLQTGRTHEELIETFDHAAPAFVGLSASGVRSLVPLARLVVALRISHPGCFILLSGNAVEAGLGDTDVSGADLVTSDLDIAFNAMEKIVIAVQSSASQAYRP